MNQTEEPLRFKFGRIVFFILLGPLLINPRYAVDQWTTTWVWTKTQTVLILCGCLVWASVLVWLSEALL